ncbi:MAG: replicative helicase loader/inhibitor [Candidatus Omnitrophica bacterium]|nr:replicative helicase loader/inhibitor [Candidatus Omnitrophota bacterium]
MTTEEIKILVAMTLANFPSMQEKSMKPTIRLWQEMLSDIPFDVGQAALKKVLSTAKFWPSVGEIREAVAFIQNPSRLSPAEAWEKVRTAMQDYGYYRASEGFNSLPPTVQKTVRALGGFSTICASENPEATRGHFLKMYEQFAEREKELSVLPPSVREFLSDGIKLLPGVN